jgi:hypothetical protein
VGTRIGSGGGRTSAPRAGKAKLTGGAKPPKIKQPKAPKSDGDSFNRAGSGGGGSVGSGGGGSVGSGGGGS